MPIARILQVGVCESSYDLILENGSQICLGTAAQVLSGSHPRAALFDAAKKVYAFPRKRWLKIAQAIRLAAELIEAGSRSDDIAEWVAGLADSARSIPDDELITALCGGRTTFYYRNQLHLRIGDLAVHASLYGAAKVGRGELRTGLARLNFEPCQLSARDSDTDRVKKGRFWRGPVGWKP